MSHKKIKVLLVDDQILFVDSLKYVLQNTADDLEIVGAAKNGIEALELTRKHLPDVILMDVRMPELDGVEATRAIHVQYPDIRIVMLTTFEDDEYVHFAVKFGAVGYLLKNMPPEDLVASIRTVMRGASLFSNSVTRRLVEQDPDVEYFAETIESLSTREKEVLNLILQMLNNCQIGEKLSIAGQSVRNYVSSIYGKFEIYDRMELIRTLRGVWDYSATGPE